MSESPGKLEVAFPMTQVIGTRDGRNGAGELLGEIESADLKIGWNRATLSERAGSALREILDRNGGSADRSFELRQGVLTLLRCRMLAGRAPQQIEFDGSQRFRRR